MFSYRHKAGRTRPLYRACDWLLGQHRWPRTHQWRRLSGLRRGRCSRRFWRLRDRVRRRDRSEREWLIGGNTNRWQSGVRTVLGVNHAAPPTISLARSLETGRGRRPGRTLTAADWLKEKEAVTMPFVRLSASNKSAKCRYSQIQRSQMENSSERAVNEQRQNKPSWKIRTPRGPWKHEEQARPQWQNVCVSALEIDGVWLMVWSEDRTSRQEIPVWPSCVFMK